MSHHPRLVILLTVAALLAGACSTSRGLAAEDLAFAGPDGAGPFNAEELADLSFSVTAEGQESALEQLAVLLDGEDVTAEAVADGATLTYAPATLPDGERTIEIVVRADEAEGEATPEPAEPLQRWTFTVDTTAPELTVDDLETAAIAGKELPVTGTTEPGATVTVDGNEVTAGPDGAFEAVVASAQSGVVAVTATDAAGNVATGELPVMTVPSRVEIGEIRAVHVSFYGWVSSRLKPPIMQMLADGKINAIQLDLKDESGNLSYHSQIPLAKEMGASLEIWDLREAVEELHGLGVPVIARIVAFADPVLANWAWENGKRDWVIQLPDGSAPYTGKYDGFSNFAHPEVRAYNIAIAEEAAQAGVDAILWDYIRRPDGGLDNFEVPGLTTTPEEAVVAFTKQADEALAPYGVQHAASVYGIAADRPTQIGQYIPGMAEHLDFVSPMIYPSHWGPGEYDVRDPNRQPYDIIRATLEVWAQVTEGKRARVVPWLEDTSYRAWNRPHQVREQIRATRDHGIDEFIMWDPNVKYTTGAYDVRDEDD